MQRGLVPPALKQMFSCTTSLWFTLSLFCLFDNNISLCFFQARAVSGIKGLFHRNPKQASLDSHAVAQHSRKHPFGAHLLRRTASAPTKGQPKIKKGYPEITIDTKDYSSEGASEDRESEDRDKASAAASQQPTPPQHQTGDSLASHQATKAPRDHPDTNGAFHPEEGKGKSPLFAKRRPMSEPPKRASRLRFHDSPDMKPGVFARVALNSSGRVGVSSNCITCVIGSKESPEAERKGQVEERPRCKSKMAAGERPEGSNGSSSNKRQVKPEPVAKPQPLAAQPELQQSSPELKSCMEPQFQYLPQALLQPVPFPKSKARQTLGAQHIRPQPHSSQRNTRSCSVPRRHPANTVTPAQSLTPDCRTNLCWQQATPPSYGAVCRSMLIPFPANEALLLSDSSSCDSLHSVSSFESLPMLPPCSVLDSRKRAVGTLQREMNALFALKMEELRNKSPMFFAGKMSLRQSL